MKVNSFLVNLILIFILLLISGCGGEQKEINLSTNDNYNYSDDLNLPDNAIVFHKYEAKEFLKWLEDPGKVTMEVDYMNYREAMITLYTEKDIRYKAGDNYAAYLILYLKQRDGKLALWSKVNLGFTFHVEFPWRKSKYNIPLVSRYYWGVGKYDDNQSEYLACDAHTMGYVNEETPTVARIHMDYLPGGSRIVGNLWLELKALFHVKKWAEIYYKTPSTATPYGFVLTGPVEYVYLDTDVVETYPRVVTFEFSTPASPAVYWSSGVLSGLVSDTDKGDDLEYINSFDALSPVRVGVDTDTIAVPDGYGWYEYGGSGANLKSTSDVLFSTIVTASEEDGKVIWWLNGVAKHKNELFGNRLIFSSQFENFPRLEYVVSSDEGFPLVVVTNQRSIFVGNRILSWYYQGTITDEAKELDEEFNKHVARGDIWIRLENKLVGFDNEGGLFEISYNKIGENYYIETVREESATNWGKVLWLGKSIDNNLIIGLVAENNKYYIRWAYPDSVTQILGEKEIPDNLGEKSIFITYGKYVYVPTEDDIIVYEFSDDMSSLNQFGTVELPWNNSDAVWMDVSDSGQKLVITSWIKRPVKEFFKKFYDYKSRYFIAVTEDEIASVEEFVNKFYDNYNLYELNLAVYDISSPAQPELIGVNEDADKFYYPETLYYPGTITDAYKAVTEPIASKFGWWTVERSSFVFTLYGGIAKRPLFIWLDDDHVMFPAEYFRLIPESVISLIYIPDMYFGGLGFIEWSGEYPVFWEGVLYWCTHSPDVTMKGNFLTDVEPLRFIEEVQPLVFDIP